MSLRWRPMVGASCRAAWRVPMIRLSAWLGHWRRFPPGPHFRIIGKVLGTTLPARRGGETWPSALAMGALMQTKGLMEVVVLAVLLEGGLIGRSVFSALVAMAMLCTVLTAPMVRWALGPRWVADAAEAEAGR